MQDIRFAPLTKRMGNGVPTARAAVACQYERWILRLRRKNGRCAEAEAAKEA